MGDSSLIICGGLSNATASFSFNNASVFLCWSFNSSSNALQRFFHHDRSVEYLCSWLCASVTCESRLETVCACSSSMDLIYSSNSPTLAALLSLNARWATRFCALRFVGGVSVAGFLPGLGRGGTTHSFDMMAAGLGVIGWSAICAIGLRASRGRPLFPVPWGTATVGSIDTDTDVDGESGMGSQFFFFSLFSLILYFSRFERPRVDIGGFSDMLDDEEIDSSVNLPTSYCQGASKYAKFASLWQQSTTRNLDLLPRPEPR